MHICFLIGHHIGEKGEQNHVVVDDLGQRTRSAGWSEAGPGRCQIAGSGLIYVHTSRDAVLWVKDKRRHIKSFFSSKSSVSFNN